jgi:membrane-associated phospholipid phosphatase
MPRESSISRNRTTPRQESDPGSCDLRSPGWFAMWPIIGILMFLVGASLFGAIAYNVSTQGPLLQSDAPLATQFHAQAVSQPERIIEFLIFGFFVGKELLQVIVVILALYFLHKRFWLELGMLLVGVGGGAIIWSMLIEIFDRVRPTQQLGIVVSDFSFPSGHAISAVICYGLLAYLFIPKMPSLFWKWVVGIASVLTMLFIGFSRLYLGGHYLTDIVAGYALGLAWAGLVFTLVESFFLKEKLESKGEKVGVLRNGNR